MVATTATTRDAYKLFHEGAKAFAAVEEAGIRIDVPYLNEAIKQMESRINKLEKRLREQPEFALVRKRYGARASVTSADQLATVLYGELGHKPTKHTKTGKIQMNEEALEKVGIPYTRNLIKLKKYQKALSTYLRGILREVEGDLLHPFFNLHTTITFRSSSSDPNFQNIPIRDPEIGKLIRRAFIPRPGHVLVEIDYSSLEVRIACCVSGDERLIHDTLHGDMHRDMAAECFMVEQNNVSKGMRQTAKGGFVFAQFYGDWYKQCAKNLWEGVEKYGLKTVGGVPVFDHLKRMGIDRLGACDPKTDAKLGTFEYQLKTVEDRFWNERFKVYNKWRRDVYKTYERTGKVELATGFTCRGLMRRNQVINAPVQGPAFHCLLWSLIQIVKNLDKHKMRSRVVGQIHDSIVSDVARDELDDFLGMAKQALEVDLRRAWKWITIPLEADVEIGENNWYEKKGIK